MMSHDRFLSQALLGLSLAGCSFAKGECSDLFQDVHDFFRSVFDGEKRDVGFDVGTAGMRKPASEKKLGKELSFIEHSLGLNKINNIALSLPVFMHEISGGADVNTKTEKGLTPLLAAIVVGNAGFVKFLINKKVDLNAPTPTGITPLTAAIALYCGAFYGKLPEELQGTGFDSYYRVLRILLDKGAVLGAPFFDEAAATKGMQALLGTTDKKELAEVGAALIGSVKDVQLSFLFFMVMEGFCDGVRMLLSSTNLDVNGKNAAGKTALHVAVEMLNVAMMATLLERGAKATIENGDGLTAVELAEIMGLQNASVLLGAEKPADATEKPSDIVDKPSDVIEKSGGVAEKPGDAKPEL